MVEKNCWAIECLRRRNCVSFLRLSGGFCVAKADFEKKTQILLTLFSPFREKDANPPSLQTSAPKRGGRHNCVFAPHWRKKKTSKKYFLIPNLGRRSGQFGGAKYKNETQFRLRKHSIGVLPEVSGWAENRDFRKNGGGVGGGGEDEYVVVLNRVIKDDA